MGTIRRNFRDLRDNLIALHTSQRKYIAMKIQEAKDKGLIEPVLSAFDINKAMRALARKTAKYYGQTSKHKPHQNDRECARRLRVGSAAYHSGVEMNKRLVFRIGDKLDGSKVAG